MTVAMTEASFDPGSILPGPGRRKSRPGRADNDSAAKECYGFSNVAKPTGLGTGSPAELPLELRHAQRTRQALSRWDIWVAEARAGAGLATLA